MSGVRAAQSMSKEPPPPRQATVDPGVQAMQDILYDILVSGMDPDSSDVPTQAVERFLFEHARSPKTREEFLAFFAAHGLSVRARVAAEPPAISLPPIQRVANNAESTMPPSVPVELALGGAIGARAETESEAGAAPGKRRGSTALWAALACVTALLGAGGYYGYTTIVELRAEVERTARHGRDNQQALRSLRDHAAGLESSVAATGELVQRMDQKSDLLIDSLLADDKKSRKRK